MSNQKVVKDKPAPTLEQNVQAACEAYREAISQRHIAENEVSQLREKLAANPTNAEVGKALLAACSTLADRQHDENKAMLAKETLELELASQKS